MNKKSLSATVFIVFIIGLVIYFFNPPTEDEKGPLKKTLTKRTPSVSSQLTSSTSKKTNTLVKKVDPLNFKKLSEVKPEEVIARIKLDPSFQERSEKMKKIILMNLKEYLSYALSNDPQKYNKIAELENRIAREVANRKEQLREELKNNPEFLELNDRMRAKRIDTKKLIESFRPGNVTEEDRKGDPDLIKK